jgi:hypothetical protein
MGLYFIPVSGISIGAEIELITRIVSLSQISCLIKTRDRAERRHGNLNIKMSKERSHCFLYSDPEYSDPKHNTKYNSLL